MKLIFKKFNDLKIEDINFNFHIHTVQTDGFLTPKEVIDEAVESNLEAIAFTDHVNKDSNWFDDFAIKINTLKNNKNIKIFFGIETKALDFNGTLDATQNMIVKSDIVVGVVHRYPDKKGTTALDIIKSLSKDEAAKIEFNLAMGLLKNKMVDVLGHPFGVYSSFYHEFPENYMEQLLVESLKSDKAIEINTKYITNEKLFFKLLKKINPYVSIGSDVHNKGEIIRGFDIIKININKKVS